MAVQLLQGGVILLEDMDELVMENALEEELEELEEEEVEVKEEEEEETPSVKPPQPVLPPPPTGALPLKRKLSGATGVLDTAWGDAQSASWTVHISFGGGALAPDMKVDLHNIAGSGSDFIAGVMGAHSFSGDTHLTLDPAWRHCAAPLLRCLYSPEAASFFIEQLLVRKTFSQAVAVCHCALYLGLGPAFFDDLYAKIAARRTVLTRDMACGDADADLFRCPAAGDDTAAVATWSSLPLHHALRWLHALGLKPKAQLANVLLYIEADGCSLARAQECAAEWHSERKVRHTECVARAKLDSETWEPHAEWAEHEAAQWRDFAGWNASLTESVPPPLPTQVEQASTQRRAALLAHLPTLARHVRRAMLERTGGGTTSIVAVADLVQLLQQSHQCVATPAELLEQLELLAAEAPTWYSHVPPPPPNTAKMARVNNQLNFAGVVVALRSRR